MVPLRALVWTLVVSAAAAESSGNPAEPPKPPEPKPAESAAATPAVNLLGKTDSQSGESRRNENIQFNLIDNNSLKELNVRMGTTASIVSDFKADRRYFGTEFGNQPAAVIHLPSSRRVTGVHGVLRGTHNNSVLNARSFFQVGGVAPARENEAGFQVTAPAWRNAWISADGTRQFIRGSVNGNVLVPRPDERTPLATDPVLRSIVEHFLTAYPNLAPNRTDIDPRALNLNSSQSIDTATAAARLDQVLGARDRLAARWAYTAQKVIAFQLVAGQNPDTTTRSHAARLTWSRTFDASTVGEFTAGVDRLTSLLTPEPHAVGPSVTIGSTLEKLGPGSGIPIDRAQNRFRYGAGFRRTLGRHTWVWGAELARLQVNGRETSSNRGVLYFRNDFGRDALTNFRLGIPSRFSTGIGDLNRGFRSWEQQYYAGGTWKAGANLDLHYSVRYEPTTGPSEVNRRTDVPFDCDCNNIAPRFGFALRLPRAWGVLRGAYGLHFGELFPVTLQQLRWNPPAFHKLEVQQPDLADPLRNAALNAGGRAIVFSVPRDLRSPYSNQYNLSWEGGLKRGLKVQLGYVGSRTPKLLFMWNTNRAMPVDGIPLTTATINDRRPNPDFFEIRKVENSSRASFDAGRAALVLPAWHGLTADAAYWWSKALDTGGTYLNTAAGDDARQLYSQSEYPRNQDLKGPSIFDQAHSVVVHLSYQTPGLAARPAAVRSLLGRWTWSSVFLAKTGVPFTVISGSDGPGFGNVDGSRGDRPNIVDPSILGRTIGHPDSSTMLLPRSAFTFIRPTDGRGNLGIGTFRRGGIRNLNASLARTWTIALEKSITLRAESLNLLNTPQFAEPNFDLTSPSFGQITNTLNDGRRFQFALALRF